MFQSGLLFNDPHPYCEDDIDYCRCGRPDFNLTSWTGNVVTEFRLICENKDDAQTSDVMYMSGVTVGCVLSFGLGADLGHCQ